jgi:hypothetical protein
MATITSFTPTTGGPSTLVTVTGTGLTGTTAVEIAGDAMANRVNVNDTTLTFRTTFSLLAAGAITVRNPGGDATSAATFTPGYTPVWTSLRVSNPNTKHTIGVLLSPIVVTALDQFGFPFTGAVPSLTISSFIAPRTLTGTLTVAASAGVWTFSNLTPV